VLRLLDIDVFVLICKCSQSQLLSRYLTKLDEPSWWFLLLPERIQMFSMRRGSLLLLEKKWSRWPIHLNNFLLI